MRAAPDQPPQTYYGHGRSVQRDEYSGDGSEISNWTSHNSELSLRSSNRARASSSQGIQGSRTISSDRSLEHLYGEYFSNHIITPPSEHYLGTVGFVFITTDLF